MGNPEKMNIPGEFQEFIDNIDKYNVESTEELIFKKKYPNIVENFSKKTLKELKNEIKNINNTERLFEGTEKIGYKKMIEGMIKTHELKNFLQDSNVYLMITEKIHYGPLTGLSLSEMSHSQRENYKEQYRKPDINTANHPLRLEVNGRMLNTEDVQLIEKFIENKESKEMAGFMGTVEQYEDKIKKLNDQSGIINYYTANLDFLEKKFGREKRSLVSLTTEQVNEVANDPANRPTLMHYLKQLNLTMGELLQRKKLLDETVKILVENQVTVNPTKREYFEKNILENLSDPYLRHQIKRTLPLIITNYGKGATTPLRHDSARLYDEIHYLYPKLTQAEKIGTTASVKQNIKTELDSVIQQIEKEKNNFNLTKILLDYIFKKNNTTQINFLLREFGGNDNNIIDKKAFIENITQNPGNHKKIKEIIGILGLLSLSHLPLDTSDEKAENIFRETAGDIENKINHGIYFDQIPKILLKTCIMNGQKVLRVGVDGDQGAITNKALAKKLFEETTNEMNTNIPESKITRTELPSNIPTKTEKPKTTTEKLSDNDISYIKETAKLHYAWSPTENQKFWNAFPKATEKQKYEFTKKIIEKNKELTMGRSVGKMKEHHIDNIIAEIKKNDNENKKVEENKITENKKEEERKIFETTLEGKKQKFILGQTFSLNFQDGNVIYFKDGKEIYEFTEEGKEKIKTINKTFLEKNISEIEKKLQLLFPEKFIGEKMRTKNMDSDPEFTTIMRNITLIRQGDQSGFEGIGNGLKNREGSNQKEKIKTLGFYQQIFEKIYLYCQKNDKISQIIE